jgi:hypothetical protein
LQYEPEHQGAVGVAAALRTSVNSTALTIAAQSRLPASDLPQQLQRIRTSAANRGLSMPNVLSSRNAAFFAAGGFMAAVFLVSAAHAVTDTIFKYSTVKTGYFGLSPLAFSPSDFNYASGFVVQFASVGVRPAGSRTSACFNANVNLPQGATITDFVVSHETDVTRGVELFLTRHGLDGTDAFIAATQSGNTGGARHWLRAPINSAMAVVDNSRYAYGAGVCVNSANSAFFVGRITYTYTNAGD